MKQLISLTIPVYNEDTNLVNLYSNIKDNLDDKYNFEIIFIDDGSSDKSLDVIKELKLKDKRVKYISFSRNFGHQYALKAGLDYALGDCVISMDSDLQHPPMMISKLLKEWGNGSKIVYTKRKNESDIPVLKFITSKLFYFFLNILSNVKLEYGIADFRLLDRQVVDVVKKSNESALFLRGLVAWTGFSSKYIMYQPARRFSGKTKYSLSKMVNMAIDAVTSFSVLPLRFATMVGFLISLATGLYAIYAVIVWLNGYDVIIGWPSVIVSILFIGGMQLMMLGILGEYISKIFLESKKRPLYVIREMK